MQHESSATVVFDLPPSEFVELYNRRIAADGAADINEHIIADYRLHGGPTGIFSGAPVWLLTTTGAKSGLRRTAPLVYTRDGDRLVVVGSKAGGPAHPAWFHNLKADRRVTVEVGSEMFAAVARLADGVERERLFASHLEKLPDQIAGLMRSYLLKTSRIFPVVVLERAHAEAS